MMNSHDSRRPASKGKKKASTPTSKKEGGPLLSPANSTTPPGFAAKSSLSPKNKDTADQKRILRHRALFIFRFYVGRQVEVTLKDKSVYSGILHCIDPDDFTVVLKNTQRHTDDNTSFEAGSTFVVQQYLLEHLTTKGLPDYSQEVQESRQKAHSFQTDTDISNNSKAHLFGRELQTASSWLDPSLDSGDLEGRGGKTSWNQFEVNEKLFGVSNTFDENLYTTKLDKTKISAAQSKAAEKLAREIESQGSQNFHVLEERGHYANDSIDEEARYSSVVRPQKSNDKHTMMSRGANAYVPPALRKADDAKVINPTTSPREKPSSPKAPAAKVTTPKVASPKVATTQIKSPKEKPASPKKPADTTSLSSDATPAKPTVEKKSENSTAQPKKGLNPNAKEFKLNATASEFVPKFSAAPAVPAAPEGYPPHGQPYYDEWSMHGVHYDPSMEDPELHMQHNPGMQYQYGNPMMMRGPPMHPMGHQMYPPPMMGDPVAYGGYPAAYNPYNAYPPHDTRKESNAYATAPPPPLPR